MRVTLVIGGLTGGGAERVCVNLANAWVARARHVTILTYARSLVAPAYAVDPNVELRDIGWPRGPSYHELNPVKMAPVLRGLERADCFDLVAEINIIAILRQAIHDTAPDLVVTHIDLTNVRVLAAMLGTDKPVIACEHTDVNQIAMVNWQRARQALYRQAAAVVAPHATIAEWLKQRGARAYAIPNPLVPPPLKQLDRSNNRRRRAVTLTRLSEEKRPALLVRAFAEVAGDFPEWDLEIYGAGELHESLARLVDELAPGRIHLRGFVRESYSVLKEADLFVSSSWIEGFGNAIWEALACGVPVVAMDAGPPIRSLVRDGVDGLIVEGGVSELASALASLMGDEARRKTLAERAPEVLTRYSLESSLNAWEMLIENVLQQSQPVGTFA